MNGAAGKIQVLTGSLRCFVLGWLSLIPWLGMPFGAWAAVVYWKTHRTLAGCSNPARAYLTTGLTLALLGLALSSAITLVLLVAIYLKFFEG